MKYEQLPNGMFVAPLTREIDGYLLGAEEVIRVVPPRKPTLSEIIDDVKEGLEPQDRPDLCHK